MPNHCYNELEITRTPINVKELEIIINEGINGTDYKTYFDAKKLLEYTEISDATIMGIIIGWLGQYRKYETFYNSGVYNYVYEPFNLNAIIPEPSINDTVIGNWYKWHNSHWDTKWDAYDQYSIYCFPEHKIIYRFNTAWGPPTPVIEELARLIPMCDIKHYWETEGFEGRYTDWYSGGRLANSEVDNTILADELFEDLSFMSKEMRLNGEFGHYGENGKLLLGGNDEPGTDMGTN